LREKLRERERKREKKALLGRNGAQIVKIVKVIFSGCPIEEYLFILRYQHANGHILIIGGNWDCHTASKTKMKKLLSALSL
jgi:hypothetical protein